jgi:hypothetical protein
MSKAVFAFSLVLAFAFAARANETHHSPNRKVALLRPAPRQAQAAHQKIAMNGQHPMQAHAKQVVAPATIEIDEGD